MIYSFRKLALRLLFLQNFYGNIQFHNHMKDINKSVDFDLLCCYVLLMQVLILELLF